ncbi:MAG: arginine--tRNA ligase [Candidatus Sungiibacteriota bacterium]
MIRDEIKKAASDAVKKIMPGIAVPDFSVEVPENPEHGDYATNVALLLAKTAKKPPMEIAQLLVPQLLVDPFERVSAAPPGFLNFWLTGEALQKEMREILKKRKAYGAGIKKEEKIQIEFISANPTGELTMGNGRGAFLGAALAGVLDLAGFRVTREYYVNDAKASTQIKELGKTGLGEGEMYLTTGLKKIIRKLERQIAALKNKQPKNLQGEAGWLIAQEIQQKNKKFIEKKLKIMFDVWLSENSLYERGETDATLKRLNEKNLVYEKDGALWLKTTAGGDDEDHVIVRSSGEPTYFYSDLAAHMNKLERGFGKIIYIWGADHHGHVKRTKAALKLLDVPEGVFEFIIMQVVRLIRGGEEVKMSKRKGEFVTLEELVDEVGLDAARFFFLMHSPDSHMDFDLELAKERSAKNPVYYVQYAHARVASIFKKAEGLKPDSKKTDLLVAEEEKGLIKKLIRFPEVVEDTSRDYQVIRLTRYATELARAFHDFYEKHRVITDDKELTSARLALVKAVQIVLQNILGLLGISAPLKM